LARVAPITKRDPANGANVYFEFALVDRLSEQPRSSAPPNFARRTIHRIKHLIGARPSIQDCHRRCYSLSSVGRPRELDLTDALVLVACVKSKLPYPAVARDLYTSAWFRKTRDLVEASSARWFVLSALYGLVTPETKIAPYDHTLNNLPAATRRDWAEKVMAQLAPGIAEHKRIVMFAGQRYREFLVGPLERCGKIIEVPMEHMARGEQLGWLSLAE
jgi:uncharacterized protein DUF6884